LVIFFYEQWIYWQTKNYWPGFFRRPISIHTSEEEAPMTLTNILNHVGDSLFPHTQNTVDYNSNPQCFSFFFSFFLLTFPSFFSFFFCKIIFFNFLIFSYFFINFFSKLFLLILPFKYWLGLNFYFVIFFKYCGLLRCFST
jgi:hypothetical protein